jgi:branched-chain amino acid transport system permease protein
MRLRTASAAPVVGIAVAAMAVLFPLVTRDAYFIQVASFTGIYVILAVSLQLLYGYTGQISFAHAGFYGIGAYTAVLLVTRLDVNFVLALGAALIVPGIVAFLVGIPTLRLRGHYLAIATLALQLSIHQVFIQAHEITGGTVGIFGIQRPTLFGLSLEDNAVYYEVIAVAAILTFLFAQRLVKSRFGRALLGIREDEVAASVIGIHSARYKVVMFTVSAMLAGLAGGLFGFQLLFISPASFALDWSIVILSMVVIGGIGSTVGAVIGAIVVSLVTQALFTVGDLQFLIYGAFIVVVMVFFPSGVAGLGRMAFDLFMRLVRRRRRARPEAPATAGSSGKEEEVVGSDAP